MTATLLLGQPKGKVFEGKLMREYKENINFYISCCLFGEKLILSSLDFSWNKLLFRLFSNLCSNNPATQFFLDKILIHNWGNLKLKYSYLSYLQYELTKFLFFIWSTSPISVGQIILFLGFPYGNNSHGLSITKMT